MSSLSEPAALPLMAAAILMRRFHVVTFIAFSCHPGSGNEASVVDLACSRFAIHISSADAIVNSTHRKESALEFPGITGAARRPRKVRCPSTGASESPCLGLIDWVVGLKSVGPGGRTEGQP